MSFRGSRFKPNDRVMYRDNKVTVLRQLKDGSVWIADSQASDGSKRKVQPSMLRFMESEETYFARSFTDVVRL